MLDSAYFIVLSLYLDSMRILVWYNTYVLLRQNYSSSLSSSSPVRPCAPCRKQKNAHITTYNTTTTTTNKIIIIRSIAIIIKMTGLHRPITPPGIPPPSARRRASKLSFGTVCSSNINRSMEAHVRLQNAGELIQRH